MRTIIRIFLQFVAITLSIALIYHSKTFKYDTGRTVLSNSSGTIRNPIPPIIPSFEDFMRDAENQAHLLLRDWRHPAGSEMYAKVSIWYHKLLQRLNKSFFHFNMDKVMWDNMFVNEEWYAPFVILDDDKYVRLIVKDLHQHYLRACMRFRRDPMRHYLYYRTEFLRELKKGMDEMYVTLRPLPIPPRPHGEAAAA